MLYATHCHKVWRKLMCVEGKGVREWACTWAAAHPRGGKQSSRHRLSFRGPRVGDLLSNVVALRGGEHFMSWGPKESVIVKVLLSRARLAPPQAWASCHTIWWQVFLLLCCHLSTLRPSSEPSQHWHHALESLELWAYFLTKYPASGSSQQEQQTN